MFEGRVSLPPFQQVFEGAVEGFGGGEGEAEVNRFGLVRRVQRTFSR